MIKKQPQRICAVCRESKLKTEMIRLVRDPQGIISLDPSGKKSGRGAYLCGNPECLKKAKKQHSLERALKGSISEELWGQIEQAVKELPENE